MKTKQRLLHFWQRTFNKDKDQSASGNRQTVQQTTIRSKSADLDRAAWPHPPVDDLKPRPPQTQPRRSRASSLVALARPLRSPRSLAQLAPFDPSLSDSLRQYTVDAALSDEIAHATLGGDDRLIPEPSSKRYSEDVAERNVAPRQELHDSTTEIKSRSIDVLDHDLPGYPKVASARDRFSEDVAQRNTRAADIKREHSSMAYPPPKQVPSARPAVVQPSWKGSEAVKAVDYGIVSSSLSPSQSLFDSSHSFDDQQSSLHVATETPIGSEWAGQQKPRDGQLARKSLPDEGTQHPGANREEVASSLGGLSLQEKPEFHNPHDRQNLAIEDPQAEKQLRAQGFNFEPTVGTDVRTTQAPAVVHEIVQPAVHEVREEQVTREIHHHHIVHRTLPIIDVEVLPTRHFVRASTGSLIEVAADALPDATGPNQPWQVVETVSGRDHPLFGAAQPTSPTSGVPEHYVGEDGISRTSTTWTHPPVLEGQSVK